MKSAAKIERKAERMAAIAAKLAVELAGLAGEAEDEAAAAVAEVEADRDELLRIIGEAIDSLDQGDVDEARLILAGAIRQPQAA
jgi:hypothetical protein